MVSIPDDVVRTLKEADSAMAFAYWAAARAIVAINKAHRKLEDYPVPLYLIHSFTSLRNAIEFRRGLMREMGIDVPVGIHPEGFLARPEEVNRDIHEAKEIIVKYYKDKVIDQDIARDIDYRTGQRTEKTYLESKKSPSADLDNPPGI